MTKKSEIHKKESNWLWQMKPKKKSKLRNAEYYDIQDVLDELYEKSKSGCIFADLMSVITSEEYQEK